MHFSFPLRQHSVNDDVSGEEVSLLWRHCLMFTLSHRTLVLIKQDSQCRGGILYQLLKSDLHVSMRCIHYVALPYMAFSFSSCCHSLFIMHVKRHMYLHNFNLASVVFSTQDLPGKKTSLHQSLAIKEMNKTVEIKMKSA